MVIFFGLPDEIVLDNGPPFGSKIIKTFAKSNGIKLTPSPEYHPQSNGSAERAVRTVKNTLKKMLLDPKNQPLNIESMIQHFLFNYRNTISTMTGKTPNQLMFLFKTKTLVDIFKPYNQESSYEEKHNTRKNINENKNNKKFEIGQKIWYRIHSSNVVKWVEGVIKKQLSKVVYIISVQNTTKRAHVDQLKTKIERFPRYHVSKKEGMEEQIYQSPADRSSPLVDNSPNPMALEARRSGSKQRRSHSESPKLSPKNLRPRHLLRPPTRFTPVDFREKRKKRLYS